LLWHEVVIELARDEVCGSKAKLHVIAAIVPGAQEALEPVLARRRGVRVRGAGSSTPNWRQALMESVDL
jgi:hypothetical protein